MSERDISLATEPAQRVRMSFLLFTVLLLLLVAGAVLRSAIATRLDGFTMDEPYHIAAGVAYARQADFCFNPEHPPLVKLWVGEIVSATGFHLSALRSFNEKRDERDFAEKDVFLNNDPDSVQRRARVAMWTLNGLLLVALAFAIRRTLGPVVALGTMLFLAIDPTVAAHLPVVMTDLPVSLLSAAAMVLSVRAFRDWGWGDLLCTSILLGLALGTKHSAPIFFLLVLSGGLVCALVRVRDDRTGSRLARLARLSGVAAGALLLLWGLYFFHAGESRTRQETFNRTLEDKIADVHSPVSRSVLKAMAVTHVAPRAYVWGLADTIRVGLEATATPVTAFGRTYWRTGPRYFFPGMIAVKVPIGLGVLALAGLGLLVARRLPRQWTWAALAWLAGLVAFLAVIATGNTYAGIRHALPAVVLLAIFAGIAMGVAWDSKSYVWRGLVGLALAGAAMSALPMVRPWEYFNEFVGGPANGFRYFNDEGVDLGQRSKELADYEHRVLLPAGEKPFVAYVSNAWEAKARGVVEMDRKEISSPNFSGTILIDARYLSKSPFWDQAALRAATPSARFGNLLVFRGPCQCGNLVAPELFFAALGSIYAEKPDLAAAEQLLKKAVQIDPNAFFVQLELGNLYLRQGRREDAQLAYEQASHYASFDLLQRGLIDQQIKRVKTEPLEQIRGLRNPAME